MKKLLLGLGTMGVLAIPLVSIVACSPSKAEELLSDVVHSNLKLNVNGKRVTGADLDVVAIKAEYNPNFETSVVNLQLRNGMIGMIKTTLMSGKNSNGFPIMWGCEWTPHTLFFSEDGNSGTSLAGFIKANSDWAISSQAQRTNAPKINVNPEAIEFNALGVWNRNALIY